MRMQWIVARVNPDVITFQEMDHLGGMQSALAHLGYSCGDPYRVRHVLDGAEMIREAKESGTSFLARVASTAFLCK
eukprot:gene2464-2498_t